MDMLESKIHLQSIMVWIGMPLLFRLCRPLDVAVDIYGDVYTIEHTYHADYGYNFLRKVSATSGQLMTLVGGGKSSFFVGVHVDSLRNVLHCRPKTASCSEVFGE